MSDLVNLNVVVKNHLDGLPENRLINALTVKNSNIEGRGIFAVRDLAIGELIFIDYPLIMGARTTVEAPAGCICCYRTDKILKPCTMGCGLPVCSVDCETSPTHVAECQLITSWKTTDLRETLNSQSFAKCLVPLRALLLSESGKDFLLSLAIHNSSRHGAELRFIKKYFQVSKAEEFLMNRACCALDANAYEMLLTTKAQENADLRGLFPVAALMNHSCIPNTRTDFDALGRMYLRASSFIPEGIEVCTSYTNLLWGTPARRHHLKNTKHFLCQCIRCSDRSEFGTFLTALKCLDRSCNGVQLPVNPLDFSSNWRCDSCDAEVTPRQIGGLQSALAGYIGSLNLENPSVVHDFIRNKMNKFLPESNHIVLEMKCRVISAIGVAEGHSWKELSVEWLHHVLNLCHEVLRPLGLLRLAGASRAPRVQLQLHRCLLQILIRLRADPNVSPERIVESEREVVDSINKCYEVLRHDLLAPKDLQLRKNLANSNILKLIEYENNL